MDATSVSQDKPKPEEQPQPQEPTPTHRGAGAWVLWLCLAPVIYVLSVGPVCKIAQALHVDEKAPGVERIVRTSYRPLVWCAMRWRPLGRALEWYLGLWNLE